MDSENMGQLIARLRKENGLTQRQLAEQLNVTDKAVSKWERGLSCPDISLLSRLSDILGISVSELLNGENIEPREVPEVEHIVETTLQYADTITKRRDKNVRLLWGLILIAMSVFAIAVCFICNFAIDGTLTWFWYPCISLIFVCLVSIPSILWGKRGIFLSLVMLSLLIIPFLFTLERIIGINKLIMPIGVPVSIVSIVYVWVAYFLFAKTKLKTYTAFILIMILAIPLSFIINLIVSRHTGDQVFDVWDMLAYVLQLAFIGFVMGYIRIKNRINK